MQEERASEAGLWSRWGPYLSERQWGTVREDYSAAGDAWSYFPHDHARSRAYRWGEDGIAGFSDHRSRLCLSLALWNGRDVMLKERLFGLGNSEGNHGEDCKELYYYLDATPSHSYLKMLYKYPQRAFPYADLLTANGSRSRREGEYELADTGVFDGDEYFDVFVEYAKASPEVIHLRVTIHNRGPSPATIHVLPHAWFRNTWSWTTNSPKPVISRAGDRGVLLSHARLGPREFVVEGGCEWLFTENETNAPKLFGGNESGFFKDAFHESIVEGRSDAVNPALTGTKSAAHIIRTIQGGGSTTIRAVLRPGGEAGDPFDGFDAVIEQRLAEADEFYATLQQGIADHDARLVHRQAVAGLIWSKQFYFYDVADWLQGDPAQPPPPDARKRGRNADWRHLNNADIISMPDKWEYPWYAAWDLAFHAVAFAPVDAEFAKSQLVLMTREWYMHPNGQLPAYEWALGDVNPPVHAWAAWRVFEIDREKRGDAGDLAFLERILHKLMLNFTWWVNRKDAEGRNVFQGGFLGLDNIGVFDRSAPLPTGGRLNQADGTSWMAMYALNLMRISLELALHNPVYEDIATKFFEHFLHIAEAMNDIGESRIGLWNDEDAFFYDVLQLPDSRTIPLKVRSLVGLIPLFAVEVVDAEVFRRLPQFTRRLKWFLHSRPELASLVSRWEDCGQDETRLFSLLRGHRMKALLRRMLNEADFLSDFGVRGLSKFHEKNPYVFGCCGSEMTVGYQPAESDSALFGGNSNWRGPIWMPVNHLIIESLRTFHSFYGDDFRVECPTGSGCLLSLGDIAEELARRLTGLFLRTADGRRPVFGDCEKMQHDPHFRDHVLFYEYFHGDSGRGMGASHQTGWTALVASLLARCE